MTPIDALRAALQDDNVKAFLVMLRHGEGTSDDDGYRRMFGGELFTSFDDHPRKYITKKFGGKSITSSAAGAPQFLARTWDGLVKQYGFTDFTPESQDLGAVALIKGRGALTDVMAGRFEAAVAKCNKEWASLPGSPYGQPVVRLEKAREIYKAAGGFFTVAEPTPTKEPIMGPFVLPAISAVMGLLPDLAKLFGSGSEVATRNVKAVELVVETAKSAIGAHNEQELVEAIKFDPAAAQSVKAAVQAVWYELQEMGGGVETARKTNEAYLQPEAKPFWYAPAFWVSLLLLPLVYMVVGAVLFRDGWSDEIKIMVITAILTGALGAITAYWMGTSSSSQRKDELAAQRRP